jgi:CRISPR/Cas system-associated protein Cas7 (RAMP superfamily)
LPNRKKSGINLNYFKEQWEGFPPEIQERVGWVNKRVGSIVGNVSKSYYEGGKEVAKKEIKSQLQRIPVAGQFFKAKKKGKAKRKATFTDVFLSRKEQQEIRKIPSYLKGKGMKK